MIHYELSSIIIHFWNWLRTQQPVHKNEGDEKNYEKKNIHF